MTRLPCGSGRDHGAFRDEKAAGSGALSVILRQRRVWNAVQRPAPCHRRQNHSETQTREEIFTSVIHSLKWSINQSINELNNSPMREIESAHLVRREESISGVPLRRHISADLDKKSNDRSTRVFQLNEMASRDHAEKKEFTNQRNEKNIRSEKSTVKT